MKKRRSTLYLLLAAVAVAALAGALFQLRTAPAYRGQSIAAWAVQTTSPDVRAREEAVAVFRTLGTNGVPALIRLLEFRDAFWRRQLWAVAPKLPPRLRQFALSAAGSPRASGLHIAAAHALAVVGPEAQAAIPALVRIVYGADARARYEAALSLGQIGKPAMPALTAALDHRDRDVRYVALCALGGARPADIQSAIPGLIRAASDTDEGVRATALTTFAKLGPALLGPLTNAVAGTNTPMRRAAAQALTQIHAPRALAAPPLLRMARAPDVVSRRAAIQALSRLGLPDRATIQTYVAALKDPAPEVRLAAIYGLNQGRWLAGPAVPALIDCLSDGSPQIREWTARLLGAMGPRASAAIPALTRAREDVDPRVREAVAEALQKLESNPKRK